MTIELQIDQLLAEYDDWRGARLQWFREFVLKNAPELEEAIKWGVGVFVYKGKPVIAYSGFKDFTKFNFFQGAEFESQTKLFNSGLDSKSHRSINLAENEMPNENEIRIVIRLAVDFALKVKSRSVA